MSRLLFRKKHFEGKPNTSPIADSTGLHPLSIVISATLFLIALIAALTNVWHNDAVCYMFHSPVFDENVAVPLRSISDIWTSQCDHYLTTNGRFIVHCFVQLFALVGQPWFAICNALIWGLLPFLMIRIVDSINRAWRSDCLPNAHTTFQSTFYGDLSSSTRLYIVAASLILLTFFPLPFDPPFQINYVWVASAMVVWLHTFLTDGGFHTRRSGLISTIWLTLLSLAAGSLHEGFSFAIGIGVVAYALACRLHLSTRQWLMAIAFAVGACICAFAPGTLARMAVAEASTADGSLMWIIDAMKADWLVIVLLILTSLYCRRIFKGEKAPLRSPDFIALIGAAIPPLITQLLSHASPRIEIILGFFASLIILTLLSRRLPSRFITLLLVGCTLLYCGWHGYRKYLCDKIVTEIRSQYIGVPGARRVDIDASLFDAWPEEAISFKYVYLKEQRATDPAALWPAIVPRRLPQVALERDTNMLVKVGPQAWVAVRSKSRPADFIVEKVLLPGILDRKMPIRVLDPQDIYIQIDTIGPNYLLYYSNHRPYLHSSLSMIVEDSAE